jgi:tetratricopeptide (TPR) repeat protein
MRARYEEAKPLFQRALVIREQALGPEHPDIAQTLSNLAFLYHHQDKYEEAMSFLQQALLMRQKVLGMDHPDTAT